MQDIGRHYDSIVEHSHMALDPEKHIIMVDYSQVPVKMKITDISIFFAEYPMLVNHPTLFKSVCLFQALAKKGHRDRVFCISLTMLGNYQQVLYRPFELESLEYSQGAPQPELAFPRAPFVLGNDGKLLYPRHDMADFILQICGSTFEQFWRADVDKVIDELISSGAMERTTGVQQAVKQNDMKLD